MTGGVDFLAVTEPFHCPCEFGLVLGLPGATCGVPASARRGHAGSPVLFRCAGRVLGGCRWVRFLRCG